MSLKIKVIIVTSSEKISDLDVNTDMLEEGDNVNYLINNIEESLKKNNRNDLLFDKNNFSLHKLKNENENCLWNNDVCRNKKSLDNYEIENNSIYCLKLKKRNDVEIPKFLKSGLSLINNLNVYEKKLKNYTLKLLYFNNDILDYLILSDNYELYFQFDLKKDIFIIKKYINKILEYNFVSNIEIKKMENNLDKIGYGKIIFSNGIIHEGTFKVIDLKNFYLSSGRIIFPNGIIYEADFLRNNNFLYFNEGTVSFPNGKILKGEFKIDQNNKINLLNGKTIYPDGKIVESKFDNITNKYTKFLSKN